jgi:hypothetical protein
MMSSQPRMFIVLLDEPGLFVFPSPAEAARLIEPPDAESEIRACAAANMPLRPTSGLARG